MNNRRRTSHSSQRGFSKRQTRITPSTVGIAIVVFVAGILTTLFAIDHYSNQPDTTGEGVKKNQMGEKTLGNQVIEFLDREEARMSGLEQTIADPNWTCVKSKLTGANPNDVSLLYSSEMGSVSFFQFRRGMINVPENLNAEAFKREIAITKRGLDQLSAAATITDVELKEVSLVKLGESDTPAVRGTFLMARDGTTLTSEVYVWSFRNRFLKLNLAPRPPLKDSDRKIFDSLLTRFGKACEQNQSQSGNEAQ